jgi:alcohol dehydrogenase
MKALVYHGPGEKAWEEVPDPKVQDDTDIIVRVDSTTICGSDLHILKGDAPEVAQGRILGHEAVGTVSSVGTGVKTVSIGDRVLVSCISACGACRFCREGRYGQCLGGGGWILGHLVDGTRAEYVRVPFADTSAYPVPADVSDEEILMLADILPAAYEVGVMNGRIQPGDSVAVVGAGPIGLSAITGAKLFSPGMVVSIDMADARLDVAKQFGADLTINNEREDAVAVIRDLTGGLGVDVAIEAVGVPATFELCTDLVRPGGGVGHRHHQGGPDPLRPIVGWSSAAPGWVGAPRHAVHSMTTRSSSTGTPSAARSRICRARTGSAMLPSARTTRCQGVPSSDWARIWPTARAARLPTEAATSP